MNDYLLDALFKSIDISVHILGVICVMFMVFYGICFLLDFICYIADTPDKIKRYFLKCMKEK